MKLNRAEQFLMNNPVRAWIQRSFEARTLREMGGTVEGGRVLEIGCGNGFGVGLIASQFGAKQIWATDLDEEQVRRARRRHRHNHQIGLAVCSVDELCFPDGGFDAVFDFGILHHVPDWQRGVAEVARVLKRGGRFFFEEVTRQALDRWIYRTLFVHPKENRFSALEFVSALERSGITPIAIPRSIVSGDFFLGVGRRV
jgi:ubiquinone/menaquinone biosynthesis C-methylase UbiE